MTTEKKTKLDLTNKEQVKSYLAYGLAKKKIFKGKAFYLNLLSLYQLYPRVISKLLTQLPTLLSYKHYFYLLEYAQKDIEKNNKIINHLYQLISNRYEQDIEAYTNRQYGKISLLPKWLPRNNKKFDKKCNFIHTFTRFYYPHLDRQVSHKIYRKTVSNLTNHLDLVQQKMCEKKIPDYNYEKLTHKNFLLYYTQLWNNPEKMENYIISRNKKLRYLIKRYLIILDSKDQKKYQREREILESLWEKHHSTYISKYKEFTKDRTLVLDFTSRLYNEFKWELVALYLIEVYNQKPVIINKRTPIILTKQESLIKNINNLIINLGNSKDINIEKLMKLSNSKLLIVTDKTITFDQEIMKLKLEDSRMEKQENYYIGNPFYYVDKQRLQKKNKIYEILNSYEFVMKKEKTSRNTWTILSFLIIIFGIIFFYY